MVLVHLQVYGACPCPCFMSMLNVHVSVHVHAAHHRCVCVCEYVFVCVFVCMFVCINVGLSGIRSAGDRNKKTNDTGTGPVYQTKPRQSGIFLVRYWTEIIDARMLMPALVF
jgi:hypothetical protein